MVPRSLPVHNSNHSGWEISHFLGELDLHVLANGIPDVNDLSLLEIKVVSLHREGVLHHFALVLDHNFVTVEVNAIDVEGFVPADFSCFLFFDDSFIKCIPGQSICGPGANVEVIDMSGRLSG